VGDEICIGVEVGILTGVSIFLVDVGDALGNRGVVIVFDIEVDER
jgi:hypothetical protein